MVFFLPQSFLVVIISNFVLLLLRDETQAGFIQMVLCYNRATNLELRVSVG